jgi:SAM-dependent methyltransferase
MNRPRSFDFRQLRRHRVADQCVCCGSRTLHSTPAILMPFVAHRAFGWAPAMIDSSWGLNTIKQGMAYSVCRSLQCGDCGLLFSDIRFSDDELHRLYEGYRGLDYTALREVYEPGYTLRNEALKQQIDYGCTLERFLEPLLPAGALAILDWGGDSGKNTPLRSRARQHDVYDISNAEVIAGAHAVSRKQALANHYDLIVCSNVLEHVPYPSDLLQDIRQLMTPQSLLYIEVPYEELMRHNGQQALPQKKHWHEHVNFFSTTALEALIANVGLQPLRIVSDASITAGLKSSYLIQAACRLA